MLVYVKIFPPRASNSSLLPRPLSASQTMAMTLLRVTTANAAQLLLNSQTNRVTRSHLQVFVVAKTLLAPTAHGYPPVDTNVVLTLTLALDSSPLVDE